MHVLTLAPLFFFQAEDGIRAGTVTGVQTCGLPISKSAPGNGWGMTETSATCTTHSGEDYEHRPTSCGPPVAVCDLKIMDVENTRELPVGDVGELWARGPNIVKCYWNKPEATAATFIDGWVRTGDLARLDDEGFCYIID